MALHPSDGQLRSPETGMIKSPSDVMGGIFLLAISVLGLVGAYDLAFGTLSGIGSGLLPKVVAVLVGAFGVLLVVQGLIWEGDHLERWHARGPVFVLGAVLVFAMIIRGSTLTLPVTGAIKIPPLGLVVAGPLAILISSLGSKETRPVEILIFSVVMTLACGLLFKELLQLPMPFDPAGIIPDFINDAYEGTKSIVGQLIGGLKNLLVG